MKKILFLDIDWVLNHDTWDVSKERKLLRSRGFPYTDLDPKCLQRLRDVVDETGCDVWLSSTWRTLGKKQFKNRFNDCYDLFSNYIGVKLHGTTPTFLGIRGRLRGDEIQHIINQEQPDVYAIVDDIDEMLPDQQPFFVQTGCKHGLDDVAKTKLINILNKEE